ncbi:MAG: hypothetical protein ABW061_01970 [Polyangiaceae bacterium]
MVTERKRASACWVQAKLSAVAAAALVAALGCGDAAQDPPHHSSAAEPLLTAVDIRRSLVVTEVSMLEGFSLQRVLGQLAAQSGVPGLTPKRLFQQWWDIFNPKPGLGLGPHCDDQVDATLGPVLNGFPFTCRPAPSEGAQASCDPFAAASACAYIPIGLFNRFDLAPENGAYCGEYRIVYAKESGVLLSDDRNLVIFEAAMPNPLPLLGLEGCRPVAQFWANLTNVNDPQTRASLLEGFYFNGLLGVPSFPPVVHVANYGDNAAGRGQVRSNQFSNFSNPKMWSLREFKLKRNCGLLGCSSMRLNPVTVKNNPYGPLFDPALVHAKASAFQAFFPGQLGNLSGTTLPTINFDVPDSYDTAQSQASGLENSYVTHFGTLPGALRSALTTALVSAGSALTPDQVVARAQAVSCAGCHRLSNNADLGAGITWPPSLGFTHVTERETEIVDGETRYVLSDALVDQFLPHRKEVLDAYLNHSLVLALLNLHPIGGFLTH